MPQSWQCEIEVYKATYHFIYAQKNFFTGESRFQYMPVCIFDSPYSVNNTHHQDKTITLPSLSLFFFRFDPGLGEWQRPWHLLLRALFLEVQDTFSPVWNDLGCQPAQLDWLFHQAAGEWWERWSAAHTNWIPVVKSNHCIEINVFTQDLETECFYWHQNQPLMPVRYLIQ